MSVDGNICFLAEVLVGIVLRRNQTGLGMRVYWHSRPQSSRIFGQR